MIESLLYKMIEIIVELFLYMLWYVWYCNMYIYEFYWKYLSIWVFFENEFDGWKKGWNMDIVNILCLYR